MNVYDFDNTIYDGESTFDFFGFCVKNDITMLKFVLPVIVTLIQYKLCRINEKELERRCEKYMVCFLSKIENPKKLIKDFWDKNEGKIKKFYLMQKREDDVIISASCDILLKEICARVGIKNLLASEIDFENNRVKSLCYGQNKVKIFKNRYPDMVIDEFYTDSKNDLPMARISKKAFYVKKNKVKEWVINNDA